MARAKRDAEQQNDMTSCVDPLSSDVTKQGRGRRSSTLAAKLVALASPDCYPERPTRIDTIETHMSWVFLTDDTVYKMKKPVRFPFLDFSSLARRQRCCEEELRLNRRFAPAVYLDVVPLAAEPSGTLRIGGCGTVVEWLVKMRRLPRERMLDVALQNGTAGPSDLRPVAAQLAAFYRDAVPVEMRAARYRMRFSAEARNTRAELLASDAGLPRDLVENVARLQLEFLSRQAALLDQRIVERRIVEAHGDLRPEHVFLGPPPQIIDCLEFRYAFRLMDPADELAFLAMECDRLGRPFVERILLATYSRVTGDVPPTMLLSFYKSFRAGLRAKLAIWHLKDTAVREPEKWPRQAAVYLGLAARHAETLAGARP